MNQNMYRQIYELAKAIDNGGLHYRRGNFEIGLGGYDTGYELSYNRAPLCAVNFSYRTFDDYGNSDADRLGIDMDKVKKIFERAHDVKLTYLYCGEEWKDEEEDFSMEGHRTRAPTKKCPIKVNFKGMI